MDTIIAILTSLAIVFGTSFTFRKVNDTTLLVQGRFTAFDQVRKPITSKTKITICHVSTNRNNTTATGNNATEGNTIQVNQAGLRIHLRHGDYLGECQASGTPNIRFGNRSSSGDEGTSTVRIPVTLSRSYDKDVTVSYSVVGGTAVGEGQDYTMEDGILTIPAGETTGNITLRVVNNNRTNDDKTVLIQLSNASNARLETSGRDFTYTILDNENDNDDEDEDNDDENEMGTPTIRFSSNTSNGMENLTSVNIPVTLSRTADRDVTVQYRTVGGTAVGGGQDYLLENGTLTIPAGQTTGNIALQVVNNNRTQPDRTVSIRLSDPTNARLDVNNSGFIYTIRDTVSTGAAGGAAGNVQFSSASSSETEANGTVIIPVDLALPSTNEVRVQYQVNGGTAIGSGVDYTLANGELVFPAGSTRQYITLNVANDQNGESDETLIITLLNPNQASLGATSMHTHTILDND